MEMTDPTMTLALLVGRTLSTTTNLPPSLVSIRARAQVVSAINCPIKWDEDTADHVGPIWQVSLPAFGRIFPVRLAPDLNDTAARLLPDVPNEAERLGICLRLWSGCLDGAKVIALKTLSGPNTPEGRHTACESLIAPVAAADPIYAAGAEAARATKRHWRQTYRLNGVPLDSILRARRRSRKRAAE